MRAWLPRLQAAPHECLCCCLCKDAGRGGRCIRAQPCGQPEPRCPRCSVSLCVQLTLIAPLQNLPPPPRFSSGFWVLLVVLPMLFLVPLASVRSTATGLSAFFPVVLTMLSGAMVLVGSFLQALTLQAYWKNVSQEWRGMPSLQHWFIADTAPSRT